MTCLIKYTTEESGSQAHIITAKTTEDAKNQLKVFLEHNNLQESQITIEMISTN